MHALFENLMFVLIVYDVYLKIEKELSLEFCVIWIIGLYTIYVFFFFAKIVCN